jgi:hypothetical protein
VLEEVVVLGWGLVEAGAGVPIAPPVPAATPPDGPVTTPPDGAGLVLPGLGVPVVGVPALGEGLVVVGAGAGVELVVEAGPELVVGAGLELVGGATGLVALVGRGWE